MGWRVVMLLPILALLLSCAVLPTEVTQSAVQVPVESGWRVAWAEAEACSGRAGDLARVRWYIVPGHSFPVGDTLAIGFTTGERIYLAEDWADTRWVARHEALHALGFHDHDPVLFGVRCHALAVDHWDTLDTLDLAHTE